MKNAFLNRSSLICVALLALTIGCNSDSSSESNADSSPAVYLLDSEPADALGVGDVRKSATDQQAVVVVGNIGGSVSPFVDGMAAFTIVDPKVAYCAAEEGCKTPWDYCCTQNEVKENIALVKLIDDQGNPISQSAKTLLGVQELSTVVVEGKAKRDEAGNLNIAATQIYVRKQ